jgi:predicted Zn finger-like uncharacterized protein
MEVACKSCQRKFRIPDAKIPSGRNASFACPKCKQVITISAQQGANPKRASDQKEQHTAYDAAEKPFDFIEEDGKTALVCESTPAIRKSVMKNLELMEYQTTVADSARDALKRMRYHVYDLIVINEGFDTDNPESNGVLIYLERLGMAVRREMFVALISDRFRTMDNMIAFHKSVNLVINTKNIDDIGKILSRGITDNEVFYRVFRDGLKEAGLV